jgi:predicted N-acetyltransferase YhbS
VPLTIRQANPADAAAAGRICHEAFSQINAAHGFPPDIDSGRALEIMKWLFNDSGHSCWVAEQDGRIIGSNCMDERCSVFGIGPITVAPDVQNCGAGRALMMASLDRARERGAAGVRLVQAAFHNRSLSLYAKLGFVAREPLSVMQGPPIKHAFEGISVRAAVPADLKACDRLCRRVHGHDRSGDLAGAIREGVAKIAERHGRITAYATTMAFWGHAVAESNLDLMALIADADAFHGPGILVPTRNAELFLWALDHGLRVVEPMTLMTVGLYNEPQGAYLCSIMY